jgi:hypothetical protein
MRRCAVPAVIAALAAALLTSLAGAASPVPNLRSASAKRGHVVVTFTLGDLAPGRIVVAVRRATAADGRLLAANVRLNEPLRSVRTATGYRARTKHTLPRGRYYVQVSGTVIGLDCTPRKPCPSHWSNVRRVRIPRL